MTIAMKLAFATKTFATPTILLKPLSNSNPARFAGLEVVGLEQLNPYKRNARTHSKGQIKAIARSIERFGFTNPVLITSDNVILAGHGRVEAARLLGMTTVPVVRIEHLSEADVRAYILADNKLAERAGWDKEILAGELRYLIEQGYEVDLTGFETPEIDAVLKVSLDQDSDELEDLVPEVRTLAVTRLGDLWSLGRNTARRHALLAGDARDPAAIAHLMDGSPKAAMVLTDPPYNVKVQGHVTGNRRHREFAMASSEMSEAEFVGFLQTSLAATLPTLGEGALLFVFMDWRHLWELQSASRALGLEQINLCVWNKSNGGMGSLYRSKHELVVVLKVDGASHRNNVELGRHGRSRTNVWDYAGVNTFRRGRKAELDMHPTVKPVAMLADAIRDVTKPGDVVLDPFGGSGSTLIAAEQTGRRARLVEIDPLYVDVALRRWQELTGQQAVLAATGETFEDVEVRRAAEAVPASDGEA